VLPSVGLSVCLVSCGKMADSIGMLLGMVHWVGPRNKDLYGGMIVLGRGSFRDGYGVDHHNEWGECGISHSGCAACSQICCDFLFDLLMNWTVNCRF